MLTNDVVSFEQRDPDVYGGIASLFIPQILPYRRQA